MGVDAWDFEEAEAGQGICIQWEIMQKTVLMSLVIWKLQMFAVRGGSGSIGLEYRVRALGQSIGTLCMLPECLVDLIGPTTRDIWT